MKTIEFLLHRPISVCMTFIALCILGIVGYFSLPVSLLPDISIPEINIQVNAPGRSAKEIEEIAITPIRRHLLNIDGLEHINSKSYDNYGNINIRLSFKSNIDIALLNINEKVYRLNENLPDDFHRPKIFKTNITDIPVEYVTMTLKSDLPYNPTNINKFIKLSEICENVVARRLEQLSDVAMVGISGLVTKELHIKPNTSYMKIAGISDKDIIDAINASNIKPTSFRAKEGTYEHTLYIESSLTTKEDVADITIEKKGKLYRLGDICSITLGIQKEIGQSIYNGKRCITMSLIKKHNAKVGKMKKEITETLKYLSEKYPEIEFSESRDQTVILNHSINSLKENFIIGIILMFFVAFIFMGNIKTPVVTAISMAAALIISFFAFFIFKISINILSLSGLILVVGMMIDNILITSENIQRHERSGKSIIKSCAQGTAEMITPMLSSTLTTIVVFVPLIFLSDIAGALFLDQSIAICIGLLVSYIISLFLLPVLFVLFGKTDSLFNHLHHHRKLSEKITKWITNTYESTMGKAYSYRRVVFAVIIMSIPLCYIGYKLLPKSKMPETENKEAILKITWEPGLSVSENVKRSNMILKKYAYMADEIAVSAGTQEDVAASTGILSANQTDLYIKTATTEQLDSCKHAINAFIERAFPEAIMEEYASDNIFNRLFTSNEPQIVVKTYYDNNSRKFIKDIETISNSLKDECKIKINKPLIQKEIQIFLDTRIMNLYNITYDDIASNIYSAFKDIPISNLKSDTYTPIVIKSTISNWQDYIAHATIKSSINNTSVPLSYLIKYSLADGLACLQGDNKGVMYPIATYTSNDAQTTIKKIQSKVLNAFPDIRTEIDGNVIKDAGTFNTLLWIFAISVILMYFILCVQFESLTQPLILLAEIPVDICFALFMLLLFGYSLNIMSVIGIIASCGIIVNDSILKIDAINNLRKKGIPVHEAIHIAGKQRIRPIIMTTLTTIIAMIPLFFTNDIGSELQQPLALGMIATLTIGTMVSLFAIPLLFELFANNKNKKTLRFNP